MQQNEYTENLFRSVDTIIAERIKHLPYDYTQLMEITDDTNANAGTYKVRLDSSEQVIAYSDNPKYQVGDKVYVLNTADGEKRFILGTFLKNSTGRIDRSNSELITLQKSVDKLNYSTEDINASLLLLPGQIDKKLESLDERFSSALSLTEQKLGVRFSDTESKLSSSLEMTAEMLKTQFADENNQLYSMFLQTAGMIQTEVRDEMHERLSRITQTADEIKSEVEDKENGLYSVISQTAGEIRSEVIDSQNQMRSLIDQTAGEIKLQVSDGLNNQQATLDILASGITARVEDMEKGYSEISQTADRISSRVESLYGNYSQITQTADMISSRVESLYGNYSEIKQTADMITSRVEGLYGNYSEIKQTADMISSRVQGIEGNYSELIQTADMISSRVEDVNGYASTIEQTAKSIRLEVDNGDTSSSIKLTGNGITTEAQEIKFKGVVTFENLDGTDKDANGNKKTIIDGGVINTGTITANQIDANRFRIADKNGGGLTLGLGSDGVNTTYGAKIYGKDSEDTSYVIATNVGVRMTHQNKSFYVDAGGAHLGKNTSFFAPDGTVVASDRNVKNSINYDLQKYENFYNFLQPVYYKLNAGTSDRYHLGFIYQDVEQALLKNDLTSQDFAGLVKNHNLDDGEIECGLRYEEFISLNTYMIQKTRKELEEKDNKIQQLENKISELEQKLNLLLETLS